MNRDKAENIPLWWGDIDPLFANKCQVVRIDKWECSEAANQLRHQYESRFGEDKVNKRIPKLNWARADYLATHVPSSETIMDIGSGLGEFVNLIALKNKFLGITSVDVKDYDLFFDLTGELKRDYTDIFELSSINGKFDIVTCFEVVEHLPPSRIREAVSIIKSLATRKVFVSVPFKEPLPLYRGHYTRFDEDLILDLFGECKYTIFVKSNYKSINAWILCEIDVRPLTERQVLTPAALNSNPTSLLLPAGRSGSPIKINQITLLPGKAIAGKYDTAINFCPHGRADLAPYEIIFPLDWDVDPFQDRNWCGQLHMWRMVDAYLIEYDKSNDSDWLTIPLKVMLDWHRYHIQEGRESNLAWKDMMVGLRAMKLAFVISQWQMGLLNISDSVVQTLRELVEAHLNFLLDYANISYSNHTFFDLHGAAALAQVVDENKRREVYEVIDQVLPRLISAQFNDFGVHLENSPEYHPFGIRCLTQLQDTHWFDHNDLQTLITKATDFFDWLKMPDGRILPIGDSNCKIQNFSVKETAFRGKNQVLNRSGYAIIRNDGDGKVSKSSYLALMGALNSRFHKHSDDLSVIWFEGEDILCDSGKYAYNSNEYRAYAISTRAHNTVEIDGQDYYNGTSIPPKLIYGSAIGAVAVHDWGYLIDASVQHVKFGVRHSRYIMYRPGAWLLVIDRLAGAQPHDFTQWFHFAHHLPDLVKRKDGYHTRLRNGKRLRLYTAGGEAVTAILEKGVTKPRVQGWISQNYARMTPNCALGYRQRGQNVVFATLLSLDDKGSTIKMQDPQRLVLNIVMHDKTETFRISVGEHSCRIKKV